MKYFVLIRNDEYLIVCSNDNPLYGYGSWNLFSGPFDTLEEAGLSLRRFLELRNKVPYEDKWLKHFKTEPWLIPILSKRKNLTCLKMKAGRILNIDYPQKTLDFDLKEVEMLGCG